MLHTKKTTFVCNAKKNPRNDVLRKGLVRRYDQEDKNPNSRTMKTMTSQEKIERIKSLKKKDKLRRRKFVGLKIRAERSRKKALSIIDVGAEAASRGDMKHLSTVMKKAYDGGQRKTLLKVHKVHV